MIVAENQGYSGDLADENSLKRRMLGAAVLIALAVIFLPLVFDGSGTESQFRSIEPLQMEPPYDAVILEERKMSLADGTPVIEFVEDDQLTPYETEEVILQTEKARQAVSPRPVAAVSEPVVARAAENPDIPEPEPGNVKPVQEPELLQAVVPRSPQPVADNVNWLIQIASFKDKINALGLRSDLKKDGHPVLVKVGELSGDSVFRVYVGPIQGKQRADQVQATLENRLNRKTLLVEEN